MRKIYIIGILLAMFTLQSCTLEDDNDFNVYNNIQDINASFAGKWNFYNGAYEGEENDTINIVTFASGKGGIILSESLAKNLFYLVYGKDGDLQLEYVNDSKQIVIPYNFYGYNSTQKVYQMKEMYYNFDAICKYKQTGQRMKLHFSCIFDDNSNYVLMGGTDKLVLTISVSKINSRVESFNGNTQYQNTGNGMRLVFTSEKTFLKSGFDD